ncbi:hypothetical protein A6D6_02899 [Alcanivorax xiamenensis]|uniref:Aminomethyltransferase folate-binding domain-containing protein n=1 Tax=Alcanivorax xiamenensis TaxID=1177156 RepID=A0ABQ6Y5U0_9GAMM|nr:folate-binding protein [Alcanivorax xiamenensis]KAF0804632.1 hypothetical protein A6D6_02899 [Alcanivorax xiamenensis]
MSAWSSLIAELSPANGGVTTPAFAICDHLAVVRVRGEEAGTYLQGQLTCDLKRIDQGEHHAAMHLSLKGRGLVSLRLVRDDPGYLILCPATMTEAVIRCLEKYRLRAKVTFEVAGDLLVAGLAGALEQTGLALPEPGHGRHDDGLTLLRYPLTEQLLAIGDAATLAGLDRANRTVIDSEGWRFLDIGAGEGQIYPGAEDLFLPQVLNYDLLGGVSFNKGCYTGQEVVARMHFKGKLKQRMAAFTHHGPRLSPGQPLRDSNGRAVGEVVDSARGTPSPRLLAVVRLDYEGELFADDQALNVTPLDLPYELPKQADS